MPTPDGHAASVRLLPNGAKVALDLWLRVRARLCDSLDGPGLTDGTLADAADAACVGFVEYSVEPGFREQYAKWYAAQVMEALRAGDPVNLRDALNAAAAADDLRAK